jgi:hypothetical protein
MRCRGRVAERLAWMAGRVIWAGQVLYGGMLDASGCAGATAAPAAAEWSQAVVAAAAEWSQAVAAAAVAVAAAARCSPPPLGLWSQEGACRGRQL